jgi:hypothetical protein
MMGSQNALAAQDIGTGTGALVLLRSVGGASGSTLAGALIASATTAATAAPGRSFEMVYAVAAIFLALVFLIALRLPNASLRETVHPVAASE